MNIETTTAYEIRRNHDGYGVYALHIHNGKVFEVVKLKEHDFLVIAIQFLANHLQSVCPNLNPVPGQPDQARPAKSDEVHAKKQK